MELVSEEIFKSCLQGEERGYKLFYEKTVPYAFSIVKRYINQADLHKDVLQESYIAIFKNLKSFDSSKGTLKFWARKIIVNTCLMQIRSSNRLSYLVPIQLEENLDVVDNHKLNELNKKDIEALLNKMPNGYRSIFMMIAIDGFNHKEVAKTIGISPETSRSQYFRAKKWIQNNMVTTHKMNKYGIL